MVRLVFRPYTQVWRTICTSVSLRASTRVSPGFTLLKHSSPSFGSYQICSYSNLSQKIMVGRCCGTKEYPNPWHLILTFIKPMSFYTRKLAYVIDSLVRVSRRVSTNHLGRIAKSALSPAGRLVCELAASYRRFTHWFRYLWNHLAFCRRNHRRLHLI